MVPGMMNWLNPRIKDHHGGRWREGQDMFLEAPLTHCMDLRSLESTDITEPGGGHLPAVVGKEERGGGWG